MSTKKVCFRIGFGGLNETEEADSVVSSVNETAEADSSVSLTPRKLILAISESNFSANSKPNAIRL
jgi:hypothetical protein